MFYILKILQQTLLPQWHVIKAQMFNFSCWISHQLNKGRGKGKRQLLEKYLELARIYLYSCLFVCLFCFFFFSLEFIV